MYAPVIALAAGGIILLLLAGMDFDPFPQKGVLGVLVFTGVVAGLVVLGNLFLLIGLLAAALAVGAAGGFMVNGGQVEALRFNLAKAQEQLERERLARFEVASQLDAHLAHIQDRQETLTQELGERFVESGRQVVAALAKTQAGQELTDHRLSPTRLGYRYVSDLAD